MFLELNIDEEFGEPTYVISVYDKDHNFAFNLYPLPGIFTLDQLTKAIDEIYNREFRVHLATWATIGAPMALSHAERYLGVTRDKIEVSVEGGETVYKVKQ